MSTEKFVVFFEGVETDDAGASLITYTGKHGTLPAFWDGYPTGRTSTSIHSYEPCFGRAVLVYFGKTILIEEGGTVLQIQNTRYHLGDGRTTVVVVGEDGKCKFVDDDEAQKRYVTLPRWYKDGEISLRPPPMRPSPG